MMTDVIREIARIVATIHAGDGRTIVTYNAADDGDAGIPEVINEFPAAIVFPGQTTRHELRQPRLQHVYEVHIQVLESAGFLGDRMAAALPLVDLIIDRFAQEIGLGDAPGADETGRLVTSCVFKRQQGLQEFEYAAGDYAGYDIVLQVDEKRTMTPALSRSQVT